MPGYDGWQVLTALKSDPATKDIPVIICSIVEEEQKGFSLGAADYLLKPILEDELLHSLDRLNRDGSISEVLVIDDDPHDLRLIEKLLSEHSEYRVVVAQGGARGWEQLQARPPQAVILDLFMPDLNGFTILERLNSSEELRELPVVVLSGVDLQSEQKDQLESLGQRLVQKGALDEKELLLTLERALRRLAT
jgi:CheY-like chemotaxis protein